MNPRLRPFLVPLLLLLPLAARADVLVAFAAELLPTGFQPAAASFQIMVFPTEMPYVIPATGVAGPSGQPPRYLVHFQGDGQWLDNCAEYWFSVSTPYCQRDWYHPPSSIWPPDCPGPGIATFEPLEYCECFLGDLTLHPPAAVQDLRLEVAGGQLHLSWTPPRVDSWGCSPLVVDRYEIHRSSQPWFFPTEATLAAVTTTPECWLPVTNPSAESFRVVVQGERLLP
jgi:hypothetical protein